MTPLERGSSYDPGDAEHRAQAVVDLDAARVRLQGPPKQPKPSPQLTLDDDATAA